MQNVKKLLLCVLAITMLVGCKFEVSKIEEPSVKLSAVIVENTNNKTALPIYKLSELTDIVLSCRSNGEETYTEIQNWDSVSSMQDSYIKFASGEYDFKLEAKIGSNKFSGEELNVTIDKAETKLTIKLKLVESVAGEGEIQISLSYPGNLVKEVTAELLDFGNNVLEVEKALTIDSNKVEYKTGKKYVDGNYWVKFRLYADENRKLLLNEKIELAVVKNAGVSKSDLVLEALDEVYTITCYDGDAEFGTINYTKRSGITFTGRDFYKDGYALSGLYEAKDFTSSAIEGYPKGTTGNKTLYIKWETGVKYTIVKQLQNVDDDGYTVGEVIGSYFGKDGEIITYSLEEAPKEEWFIAKKTEEITLDSTKESNVINVYYDRKVVKITLKRDEKTIYKVLEGRYGKKIESVDFPNLEGKVCLGWEKDGVATELPETYPSEDCEYILTYIDIEAAITKVTAKVSTIGSGYTGTIPIEIEGENLEELFELSPLQIEGGVIKSIDYGNTLCSAIIALDDYTVGEKIVKISSGNLSASTTVKVLSETKCFSVGDILFSDGTRIKAADFEYGVPDAQKSKAVAVVVATRYGGIVGLGVGLQQGTSLEWAKSSTTGYNTDFTGIEGGTISGDIDGSDNWAYICSVDPTGTADAATNYPVFDYANNYGTNVGLTGEYAEGWYVPSLCELYNVYLNKSMIQESLDKVNGFTFSDCYWSSTQEQGLLTSYANIMLFSDGYVGSGIKSNKEYVLVLHSFDYSQFSQFVGYEAPCLTAVSLETNVVSENDEITLTITGENFNSPLYRNIVLSGGTFREIEYVNTTTLRTTVSFGAVGTNTITVSYGATSLSADVEVLPSFSVGDVLFSDGTRIKASDVVEYGVPESQKSKAVAVVVATRDGGTVGLGVGLQQGTSLAWAPSGTAGYTTNFVEIQGTKTDGDIDGSDNWAYICSVDTSASANASYYPIFNYANNYGVNVGLTGEYAEGWYVPSIYELSVVYLNKSMIQKSLDKVGGLVFTSGYYWSSSQSSSAYKVGQMRWSDGSVLEYSKDDTYCNVLVLHIFDYNQFENFVSE